MREKKNEKSVLGYNDLNLQHHYLDVNAGVHQGPLWCFQPNVSIKMCSLDVEKGGKFTDILTTNL